MDEDLIEDLRLTVYRQLAESGAVEDTARLAKLLGVSAAEINAGLAVLHASRELVCDDAGAVVLAHPLRPVTSASPSWAQRRCGGVAARGMRLPYPT